MMLNVIQGDTVFVTTGAGKDHPVFFCLTSGLTFVEIQGPLDRQSSMSRRFSSCLTNFYSSFVIQLAKLEGLKVIASAGSDDKVNFLKEIGVDVAFNYKSTSTREVLEREGPINMQAFIWWERL